LEPALALVEYLNHLKNSGWTLVDVAEVRTRVLRILSNVAEPQWTNARLRVTDKALDHGLIPGGE
jgi:hypothetical protein